jgi:ABC-type multidrug transport system ATPase subunit
VLFVSHNMAGIQHLCPRSMWLDNGVLRGSGPSHELVRAYLATLRTLRQPTENLPRASHAGGAVNGRDVVRLVWKPAKPFQLRRRNPNRLTLEVRKWCPVCMATSSSNAQTELQ